MLPLCLKGWKGLEMGQIMEEKQTHAFGIPIRTTTATAAAGFIVV